MLNRSSVLRNACLVTALALAGCSALQIDVDVYKGPLSSQREVQLRQVSTLAIAAKPLLAELRNDAEKRDPKARLLFEANVRDEQLERYSGHTFTDDLARFTNGVLSFYDDQGPQTLVPQIDKAQEHFNKFSDAMESFDVWWADCQLADDLALADVPPGLKPLWQSYQHFLRAGALTGPADKLSSRCASRGGQRPSVFTSSAALGKRRIEDVRAAWNNYCAPPKPAAVAASGAASAPSPAPRCKEMERSVSWSYLQLSEEFAHKHAQALYPAPKDAQRAEKLEKRLVEIGKSFVDARASMKKLTAAALQLLEDTENRSIAQRRLVAALVANVVQPRVLACGAQTLSGGEIDIEVQKTLIKEIPNNWSVLTQRDNSFAKGFNAVRAVAVDKPASAARTIREIDRQLPTADQAKLATCDPYKLGFDEKDTEALANRLAELKYVSEKFSLARGTAEDNDLDLALRTAATDIRTLSGNTFGFEDARTRTGIVTLTRDYQNAVNRANDDPGSRRAVDETRRLLEEQLITFAERVLYVANNYDMLGKGSTQSKTEWASGDPFPNQSGSGVTKDDPYFAKRAAILQAVGNSIIVQIDDIRRQNDHTRSLVSKREAEAVAINRAFAGNASQTFDALLQELKATVSKDIKEAERLKAEAGSAKATATGMEGEIQTLTNQVTAKGLKVESATEERKKALDVLKPVRYAALTLLPNHIKTSVSGIDPDNDSPADIKNFPKAVSDLMPSTSNGEEGRAAIQAWLAGEMEKVASDSPRFTRLESAKFYFERNIDAFKAIPARARNLTLIDISNVVKSAERRYEDEAKAADSKLINLAKDLAADKKSLDARNKARTEKSEAGLKNEAAAGKSLVTVAELNAILDVVKEVRGEVLNAADEGGSDAKATIAALSAALKKRAEKFVPEPADAKNPYKLAGDYLAKMGPLPALTVASARGSRSGRNAAGERSQVDVLDDLIAHLRHQHLNALANSTPERAASVNKALEAAYQQRAGMAYLRPASAYLRNVYAATSVQSDPDVGWVNLLWRNASRALVMEKEEQKARVNVEKQFWQTINTVQLGGGGAANYVVVKDDVGNWYVKAYGGDTSSIIQSAQSLALFNMGKKFDVNLLKQSELRQQLASTDLSAEKRTELETQLKNDSEARNAGSGASTAGLANVQKKYASEYATKTADELSTLSGKLVAIAQDIEAGWNSGLSDPTKAELLPKLKPHISGELPEISAAQSRLATASGSKEAELPAATADAIIDALRSVKRLRTRLVTAIQRQSDLVDPLKTAAKDREAERAQEQANLDKARGPDGNKDDVERLEKTVKDKTEIALKAADAVKNATANQAKAAEVVGTVLDSLVSETVARRVDAADRLMKAYGFIGEAAAGK